MASFLEKQEIIDSLADNRTGAITHLTMQDWVYSMFQGYCMGYWSGESVSQSTTTPNWELPASPLDFTAEDTSDGGAAEATSRCRYDINEDGTYLIYANVGSSTGSVGVWDLNLGIAVNGVDPTVYSSKANGTGGDPGGCWTMIIRKLSAGDYVEPMVFVNSGTFDLDHGAIIIVRLMD